MFQRSHLGVAAAAATIASTAAGPWAADPTLESADIITNPYANRLKR